MEIISNKSDKNLSVKNKNTISYKSVSEISEFDEGDREEPSDFVINTNNTKSVVSQHSKLNDSMHSVASHFSSKDIEEKEEDDNRRNLNRP